MERLERLTLLSARSLEMVSNTLSFCSPTNRNTKYYQYNTTTNSRVIIYILCITHISINLNDNFENIHEFRTILHNVHIYIIAYKVIFI